MPAQKEPKISVIMPVYNAERYVAEAIKSILDQTFSNFEFIIIDDGSTDKSTAIIEKYAIADSRIRVLRQGNQGVAKAINNGFQEAGGEFLARMDADDIAYPERFTKQIAFLRKNTECVAVGCRTLLIDPEGLEIGLFMQQQAKTHGEIDLAHMKGRGGAITHPSVIFRSEALRRIGGYREVMEPAEDLDLFLRLAEIGRLANLEEVLLKYRMHLQSTGSKRRLEQEQKVRLAIREARQRRGLPTVPEENKGPAERNSSASELHCMWAWWALNSGNIATARKHAFIGFFRNPFCWDAVKAFLCSLRGR